MAEEKGGMFSRLARTRANLAGAIGDLLLGEKEIDETVLEEVETQLLVADIGVEATSAIIENLTARVRRRELNDPDAVLEALKTELQALLASHEEPLDVDGEAKPFVILVVGVNGAGKTTTIGKIARKLTDSGRSVLLAAGDTFRAAAVDQLKAWGERNEVPVVAQPTGSDAASVVYDALEAARARNIDVVLADTAGRLQNKQHLMDELEKVVRVIKRFDETAPHEVLLVLDAGTGQNAVSQAREFTASVGVTGISLSKLDGTARGGVIFAIAQQFPLPIRFVGVGETAEDLRPFRADEFVEALFDG